jgi:hypothetical protein
MYQIILSLKRMNARILQMINDIEQKELQLFDRIKNVNQMNTKYIKIRNALKQNDKD